MRIRKAEMVGSWGLKVEDLGYLQEVQPVLEVQHHPAEGQESVLFTDILIQITLSDLP